MARILSRMVRACRAPVEIAAGTGLGSAWTGGSDARLLDSRRADFSLAKPDLVNCRDGRAHLRSGVLPRTQGDTVRSENPGPEVARPTPRRCHAGDWGTLIRHRCAGLILQEWVAKCDTENSRKTNG